MKEIVVIRRGERGVNLIPMRKTRPCGHAFRIEQ